MIKKTIGDFRKTINLLILLTFFVSHPCLAGLANVKSIIVTPSQLNKSGWLQVSEIVAIQTGTGKDLALNSVGAVTSGSPSYSKAANSSNIITGVAPDAYPRIYHSKKNDGSAWVKVTLKKASELNSVIIYGRANGHSSRDIYDISIFNAAGKNIFNKTNLNADNQSHSVSINFVSHHEKNAVIKKDSSPQTKAKVIENLNADNQPHSVSQHEKNSVNKNSSSVTDRESELPNNRIVEKQPDLMKLLREGSAAKNKKNYELAKRKFQEILSHDETRKTKRIHNTAKKQLAMIETYEKNTPRIQREKIAKPVKSNQPKKIYSEEKVQELHNQAWLAHGYENNVELAKKLYLEIMDHSPKNRSYYSAKRELQGIEEAETLKKKKDEFNKRYPKQKSDMNWGKVAQIFAQPAIDTVKKLGPKVRSAEEESQLIKVNNERFKLTELEFDKDSIISLYGMSIGKTKKTDAIKIYNRFVEQNLAHKVSKVALSLMQPTKQISHKIHKKVSLECFGFSGIIKPDCLYFYNNILVGGRFHRYDQTNQLVSQLKPFFPVIKSSSNSRKELSNDDFLLKSLYVSTLVTKKIRTTSALNPVGVLSYDNKTYTTGEVCILPKELQKLMAEFHKTEEYNKVVKNTCY